MRHAASHLGCTSQSHLSFGPLSFSSYSHLNAAHHICTSSAHLHPSDAPLFHLIFKAKCYQAGSLVPLAWLPQLSLKVGLNRGVAAARSAAVSPRGHEHQRKHHHHQFHRQQQRLQPQQRGGAANASIRNASSNSGDCRSNK